MTTHIHDFPFLLQVCFNVSTNVRRIRTICCCLCPFHPNRFLLAVLEFCSRILAIVFCTFKFHKRWLIYKLRPLLHWKFSLDFIEHLHVASIVLYVAFPRLGHPVALRLLLRNSLLRNSMLRNGLTISWRCCCHVLLRVKV